MYTCQSDRHAAMNCKCLALFGAQIAEQCSCPSVHKRFFILLHMTPLFMFAHFRVINHYAFSKIQTTNGFQQFLLLPLHPELRDAAKHIRKRPPLCFGRNIASDLHRIPT